MSGNNMEIERKFLIEYPGDDFFMFASDKSDIIQTYLSRGTAGTERVRKRRYEDRTVYTHTVKRAITDVSREEIERVIGENEYNELLVYADSTRQSVRKTRYLLNFKGQCFEIDIYPFWRDRAIMELEMDNEAQEIIFPPCVRLIREVTDEKQYRNSAIARAVPEN